MAILEMIKIIGACAAIVGTCFNIINSKRFILRSIDRKESRIRKIDHELILKYGLDRGRVRSMCALDFKKNRLQEEVEDLKRFL